MLRLLLLIGQAMAQAIVVVFKSLWGVRWFLAGGLAVLGAIWVFMHLAPTNTSTAPPAPIVVPTVSVERAQPIPWVTTVRLSGRAESPQPIPLPAPTGGQLTSFTLQEGQRVTTGQILATITPVTDPSATAASTHMQAPQSGTLTQITRKEGALVGQGEVLALLTPPAILELVGYVPAAVQAQLTQGKLVNATMSNGQAVNAILTYIAPAPTRRLGFSTGQYRIHARLQPAPTIPSGLTTSIAFPIGLTSAVRVPAGSLIASSTRALVVISNTVTSYPVQKLSATPSGTWVQGLPADVPVLTGTSQSVSSGTLVSVTSVN